MIVFIVDVVGAAEMFPLGCPDFSMLLCHVDIPGWEMLHCKCISNWRKNSICKDAAVPYILGVGG